MKSPAGYDQPRRKAAARKQVRLDLRRPAAPPPPEDELDSRQRSNFWKWFGLIALFHLLLLATVAWFYRSASKPIPPAPFISLVPMGDTVKGTPGTQSAPKVGATTPAPAVHHHHHRSEPTPPEHRERVTPPPPPVAVEPPPRPHHERVQPKPIAKVEAPALVEHKEVVKHPEKRTKPKPKIKVDLTLENAPAPVHEKHVAKEKHAPMHPPAAEEDRTDEPDESRPDTMGLSREQIAAKLGAKLAAAGVHNAVNHGISGSRDSHANEFADFYASIHDQFMDKWQDPNQNDPSAVDPVVQIHVDKDGRVPAGQVTLVRSSGNPVVDDSALAAARSLGYLLQPLPDGCPPDISITLKLTR